MQPRHLEIVDNRHTDLGVFDPLVPKHVPGHLGQSFFTGGRAVGAIDHVDLPFRSNRGTVTGFEFLVHAEAVRCSG